MSCTGKWPLPREFALEDEIAALRAENEAMRKALERVVETCEPLYQSGRISFVAWNAVHTALAAKEKA